jgi:hypothetical protein
MEAEAELFEIVRALYAPRSLPRRLNGGQEQRYQDSNDRDHDQQLDEREATAYPHALAAGRGVCGFHGYLIIPREW